MTSCVAVVNGVTGNKTGEIVVFGFGESWCARIKLSMHIASVYAPLLPIASI